MKCETCHRALKRKRVDEYNYKESGVPNVLLMDIDVLECPACGDRSPLIPSISVLHAAMAEAFALKPSILNGSELRFIRKELKLSAKEFAHLLGVDHSTVSRWENNKKNLGRPNDRLVRLFYFRYIEEKGKASGNRHILEDIAETDARPASCEVKFPSNNPSHYKYFSGGGACPA